MIFIVHLNDVAKRIWDINLKNVHMLMWNQIIHTKAEEQICLIKCADLHETLSFLRKFTEQSLFILCCIIASYFYSGLENLEEKEFAEK